MSSKTVPLGFHVVRRDRLLQEQTQDTYRIKGKLEEPTSCPQCGAVFSAGRWHAGAAPKDAHHRTCPACSRINDNYPAGFVHLAGAFLGAHRDEIMSLVRNEEQRQRSEHPLKRIMAITEQDGAFLVTTTDVHLARGIGEAVHHAYQGALEFQYKPDEHLLRVHWQR